MKDTVRIILFPKCNLKCKYCCNEQEQFNSQFKLMKFEDIDFSQYQNVCVTGGEPFLEKTMLFDVMNKIPSDKNIFLYTNGLLISKEDIEILRKFQNLQCVNIGIHFLKQIDRLVSGIDTLPIRYCMNGALEAQYRSYYGHRLKNKNIKFWTMDECNAPNEDWILLNQDKG